MPAEVLKDMPKPSTSVARTSSASQSHAFRNGMRIVKIMLHVSKESRKSVSLERIDTPAKNWEFNAADVLARNNWDEYMKAYEQAINATATEKSPGHVVPADDKKILSSSSLPRSWTR